MNPSQLYACTLGGIIACLLLARVIRFWVRWRHIPHWIRRLFKPFYNKLVFSILKHVVYPQVFRGRSRYWVLLQTVYWAGTFTCNFIKTHSLSKIATRAGNLAILNFVPLILAGRLSLAADLLGVPIRSYVRIHGTLGVMTFVQATLHAIISIKNAGWHPAHPVQFYGLLVRV